jgi:hypothetical protein
LRRRFNGYQGAEFDSEIAAADMRHPPDHLSRLDPELANLGAHHGFVGVDVAFGTDVGVGAGGFAVGVAVGFGTGVSVAFGAGVFVGFAAAVAVAVGFDAGVLVDLAPGVGVGVSLLVTVAVPFAAVGSVLLEGVAVALTAVAVALLEGVAVPFAVGAAPSSSVPPAAVSVGVASPPGVRVAEATVELAPDVSSSTTGSGTLKPRLVTVSVAAVIAATVMGVAAPPTATAAVTLPATRLP